MPLVFVLCTTAHFIDHASAGVVAGPQERRLINDLMANYNKLERPVANESEAVVLTFGLTLQQIIDVVMCLIYKKYLRQRKYLRQKKYLRQEPRMIII